MGFENLVNLTVFHSSLLLFVMFCKMLGKYIYRKKKLFYFCLQVIAPRRHPSRSRVCVEKYLQLKETVSIREKISICLIRGRMELLGNDVVSIVHSRK